MHLTKTQCELLEKLSNFYHLEFTGSDDVRSYLQTQGITDEKLFTKYRLGFSTNQIRNILKDDKPALKWLKEFGLLDAQNNDKLTNHIIFPIFNEKKEVINFEGISLTTNKTLTIRENPHTSVFDQFVLETNTKQKQLEMLLTEKYELKHVELKGSKLNITVKITNPETGRFILDSINLYNGNQRHNLMKQVANLFNQDPVEVEDELLELIKQLEQNTQREIPELTLTLTEEQRTAALNYLKDPNLLTQIVKDYEQLGYIGEEINKKLAYIVMTSRKTKNPLSLIIMSTSAAGKSSLQKSTYDLCPKSEKRHFTRITPQSLYYQDNLKHKFLSIEEEEGSNEANYSLKILLSAKELSVATPQRYPTDKKSNEIKAEGPISVMVSTTSTDIESELSSRALIITIDESQDQTQRIHSMQRIGRTLSGKKEQLKRQEIIQKHHVIQYLLQNNIEIINNFAEQLTFPTNRLAYRRYHDQYLNLIDAVAFLRQYQKEVKTCDFIDKYIEVDETDIQIANEIFYRAISWSIDELKPNTRRLLTQIIHHCKKEKINTFTRREIRTTYQWEHTSLHRNIRKLCDLEYIRGHPTPNGGRQNYELLIDSGGGELEEVSVGLRLNEP